MSMALLGRSWLGWLPWSRSRSQLGPRLTSTLLSLLLQVPLFSETSSFLRNLLLVLQLFKQTQEQLIMWILQTWGVRPRNLNNSPHLFGRFQDSVLQLRLAIILLLGHLLDFWVSLVELLIQQLSLQIEPKGLHHCLESLWQIVRFAIWLIVHIKPPGDVIIANILGPFLFRVFLNFIQDPLSLSSQNVLEPLQIPVWTHYLLEVLEREFIILEHCFYLILVQIHHVLFEEAHKLAQVQWAGAISVKFSEDGLDDLILSDFLLAHQVLLFDEGDLRCFLFVVLGLLPGRLPELAELYTALEPVFDLMCFQLLMLFQHAG